MPSRHNDLSLLISNYYAPSSITLTQQEVTNLVREYRYLQLLLQDWTRFYSTLVYSPPVHLVATFKNSCAAIEEIAAKEDVKNESE